MAIQAMPHMISSVHHAVILRGRHLDDASAGGAKAAGFAEAYAAAKPAALAPPAPSVNGSALICHWQPQNRGSTPPCECLGSLLEHALNGPEVCVHILL